MSNREEVSGLLRAARFKQQLCRILIVVLIAGTILPGLGLGISPVSAAGAYTVTYDGNGNDGGNVPVDPTGYDSGDVVLVHDNSNGLMKHGYVFGGWNTAANGSGTDYLPGQTFKMGSQNVTLYAKWINSSASWTNRSSVSSNLNDVVYGNDAFYAVGKSGTIASSIDGSIWTKQTSVTTKDLLGITSGNGKLVAVGASGTILVSSNGEDWSHRPSGTTSTLRGVVYGNGMFVAVGDGGTIVSSRNGNFWVPAGINNKYQLNDIAYANGKFIAVGNDGFSGMIWTSSDGQNWTITKSDAGFNLFGVAAGNDLFVAVGESGAVLTSNDGLTWTNRVSGIIGFLYDITFGNGMFVAVGMGLGEFSYSTNGINWISSYKDFSTRNGVAYGNGTFVVVGDTGIATSADGMNWNLYQAPSLNGMTYGNGQFAAVGASGGIYTSSNGAKWKRLTSNTANELRGVTYGGGLFVAVGDNGTIVTSSNGADWTVRTSPTSNRLNGVTYGNGKFVAVGASGTVLVSGDGVNWSLAGTGFPSLDMYAVAYKLGQFAAVGPSGTDGMVYTFTDGETWVGTAVPGVNLYGIAGSDALFVAAGLGTDVSVTQIVYGSGDGSDWIRIDSGTPQPFNSVAFDNGTYVLVGNSGVVSTSQDGIHYTSVSSGISSALRAVAGGGGTFVAAGQSGAMAQPRKAAPAQYVIHFDENGGNAKASPAAIMLMPGETVGALPAPPSRTGYSFGGWNTQPDGSGTALDESSVVTADTVVYAQWVTLPPVPTHLTGKAGDGEAVLNWDASPGAASYTVYQYVGESAPSNPNDWTLVQDNITSTSHTVTGLTNGTTYTFAVTAVNAVGESDYSAAATVKAGGSGTIDDPYLISSPQRLETVSEDLDGYYVLTNDIDMSGYGNWTPIGWGTGIDPFIGHFDGKGHTISGLTVRDNLTSSGGLFAEIGSGGEVRNLVLADVDISTPEAYGATGALAGELEGQAVNIRVSGGTVEGQSEVGGLVGRTGGGAVISASCADVKVIGRDFIVGGLVGYLANATVNTSCSTGDVSGSSYVGGLAGTIDGSSIADSYASGSVTGDFTVGGLIGGVLYDTETNQATSTVERVHASGKVQISDPDSPSVGGLIGANTASIHLVSAYYDKDKTGQSDEEHSSGTPLTHEQMGQEASFEDWDFDTIWHLDSRDGWPTFLRDDDRAPEMGGAAISNDSPYEVVVSFTEAIEADNEALDRFSITVNGNAATVAGKQLSGNKLILTLSQQVLNGQEVVVAYTDGDPAITDKKDQPMASHTIKADNGTKPLIEIVSLAPADNATDVEKNPQLVLTFSETVEALSGKYIRLMDDRGSLIEEIEATSSRVHIADQVVTITPDASLLPLTGYYVLIDSGAFRHSEYDVFGGISDPTAWNFVTAPDPAVGWEPVGQAGFTDGRASSPVLKAGADGTLYVLYRDEAHGGKASVMMLADGETQWSQVGRAGFSSGKIGAPSLLVDGEVLYAAFNVVASDKVASIQLMKYELDGDGDWTPAANPIEIGATDPEYLVDQDSYPILLKYNGEIYVAYRNGTVTGAMTVKKLNASGDWVTVGNADFSEGDISDPSLVVLDDTLYAGFTDYTFDAGYGATVMKFNTASGKWELVGSRGFTSGNAFDTSLVTDGKRLYVIYENEGHGAHKATAMYYDSDQDEWVTAGSNFSAGQAFGMAAAADNGGVYAAFQDAGRSDRVSVKKYAGGQWVTVGTANVTPGRAYDPSLIVDDGMLYVVYEDGSSSGKLSAKKYEVYHSINSSITPVKATFDLNEENPGEGNYADVAVTMALNGHTLSGISRGGVSLVIGEDYKVSGDTVTIKKEYLEKLSVGRRLLTFAFSEGKPRTLRIAVTDSTHADAPVLQSAEGGNTRVVLTWNTVPGATGYKVFTSQTSGTYGTEAVTVGASVYSYTVTGLTNGTTYYFAVKSVKSARSVVESEFSNELSAIPYTVPSAPTNVTAVAGNRQATVRFAAPSDNGGSEITGYEVTVSPGGKVVSGTASPIVITGLQNGTRYTFTVRAVNKAGSGEPSDPSNEVVPRAPSSGEDLPPEEPKNDTHVSVLINGKEEQAGTASTSVRNGQTVTTITIDPVKLDEKLAEAGLKAVVTIPVPSGSDVVIGELNGQMIRSMEDRQAILEIRTDRATYTLPAQQIQINAISDQFGASVALQDIKVQVEIGAPAADAVRLVENAAKDGSFTIVAPPVEFTIRAIYEGTTVEISNFSAYVERTIAIPDGADPGKITTGVVVEPDGTVRHVPTKIIQVDGQYYAVIHSLTNSTYAVVWHPVEFRDVAAHWAKDAVNNMGSRMIVEGTGGGRFSPDRNITRAEFAAIIVRALGLGLEKGPSVFPDVKESDWSNSAIRTAYAHGLLGGYADGTFRPNDPITREQAMVILSKAMAITGLKSTLQSSSADAILRAYEDASKASRWAVGSIADCVQAGIVSGRSGHTLAPQDLITRAEAAAMIERLLRKSDLI
jgi:uncharacterized repeat protein (TIGR02543 family)